MLTATEMLRLMPRTKYDIGLTLAAFEPLIRIEALANVSAVRLSELRLVAPTTEAADALYALIQSISGFETPWKDLPAEAKAYVKNVRDALTDKGYTMHQYYNAGQLVDADLFISWVPGWKPPTN